MKNVIQSMALLIFIASCNTKNQEHVKVDSNDASGFEFKSDIKYADCFTIIHHENYKQVLVFDVWNNKDTLSNNILIPNGSTIPSDLPKHDYTIPVPISKVAPLSSTHFGFIELVGELDAIIGVTNGERLYNRELQKRYNQGKLAELGTAMSTNLELILDLQPDVVMKTGFEDVRNNDERILDSGIPIAYNIEWMETNMLGRAEWIKFVGAFFCKEREADSVFRAIESQYLEVTNLVKNIDDRPTVLSGSNSKGTWFMPGGKSYIAQLINDAGGAYHYKNESSKGSIPLSFEIVLENLVDADIWVGPRASSLPELLLMDERYELFKAYQTGQVYNIDNRVTETGGNDYWESGVARPDLMLKDIISIFHPDLLPDHELHFYRKLTNEPYIKSAH
jgi:iron complex transport system substrate-binding protein